MIKSFSGQVVFCFAILRAISAYVGEKWLSQYTDNCFEAVKVLQHTLANFTRYCPSYSRQTSYLFWFVFHRAD